jgi:hypothetical protein
MSMRTLGRISPAYRAVASGVLAVAAYLGVLTGTAPRLPTRLLFDGDLPPLPYNWVAPPPQLAATNSPPLAGSGRVPVSPQAGSVSTGDGQATVIFPEGAIPPRPGEDAAEVRIIPLDPTSVAAPPVGMRFDGNAYRIVATYVQSRVPVSLQKAATVVLRYPVHATDLLLSADGGWTALPAETVPTAMQIFAATERLGIFVAAAPAISGPGGLSLATWWAYLTSFAGLVLAAIGWRRQRSRIRGRPVPAMRARWCASTARKARTAP